MSVIVRSMRELRELEVDGAMVDHAAMTLHMPSGEVVDIESSIPTIPFRLTCAECFGGKAETFRRASPQKRFEMLVAEGCTRDEAERILDQ